MRIIGGSLKRRIIPTAALAGVRPTTDRVRESMFNILHNHIALEGIRVLDLFAGSGALGFEAISRGALHCHFVEKNRRNAVALEKCADTFGIADAVSLMVCDVSTALSRLAAAKAQSHFGLIFSDPPYSSKMSGAVLSVVAELELLAPGGIYIAEHAPGEVLRTPQNWQRIADREMGDTVIEFFQRNEERPNA